MSWFIMLGAVIGSFAHLILKDNRITKKELKSWKTYVISLLSGIIATGAYFICVKISLLPKATDISAAIGIGAFVGYTFDSLIKKIYRRR